jgi:hypothetical protein
LERKVFEELGVRGNSADVTIDGGPDWIWMREPLPKLAPQRKALPPAARPVAGPPFGVASPAWASYDQVGGAFHGKSDRDLLHSA